MVRTIYAGGTIVPLSPTGPPEAEALAVDEHGLIVAIGDRDDVLALQRPGTTVVELSPGHAVLPGFVEAHGHPIQVALALAPPAVDVRPFTAPTADAVLDRIRAAVSTTPPGTPLLFSGIDPLLQRGLERPTMASLDALAPDHPVVVVASSLHAAYGNRRMFDLAGITDATPDPPGAEYVRAGGVLTGEVRETAAVFALTAPAHAARAGSLTDALRWAYQEYARAGFTTVGELAADARLYPLMRALADEEGGAVRVRAYRIGTPELAADPASRPGPRPPSTDRFAQVGVKLWADGSPWIGNVATSFPYLDTDATRTMGLGPCHHGGMNYGPDELASLVDAFDAQGWQLAVHVHGDVAVDAVLDALERAAAARAGGDRRPRLEHCGAMRPDQFRRAASLGVTASLFVAHLHHWGDVLVDDLFGPDRGAHWMAARSALDAGLRISLHNDGTVTPPDPLGSVSTAVTRRAGGSGRVLAPEERISVDEALRAVTADAAWQLGLDDVGRLEVGSVADLVVLSADPRKVPPDELGAIEVLTTILGDRPVRMA